MNRHERTAITIRPGRSQDLPYLLDFGVATWREQAGGEIDIRLAAAGIRRILSDERLGTYFLAECRGATGPVGQVLYSCGERDDLTDSRISHIRRLYVRPKSRRRDVAAALVKHCMAVAMANARGAIIVEIFPDNKSSQAVFRGLEFEPYADSLILRYDRLARRKQWHRAAMHHDTAQCEA